jgi:hypothetical protein
MTALPQAGQCLTCIHWQRRGGAVFPGVEGCTAVEDEHAVGMSSRVLLMLQALAPLLAERGACPGFKAPPDDSYRAADLPPA